MSKVLPKAIAVVGPTAAGKTKLGIEIARRFNGEIISADSRQVYKYLDICTGKDLEDYVVVCEKTSPNPLRTKEGTNRVLPLLRGGGRAREVGGAKMIPYYMIDILEPNQEITAADFQKKAFEAIDLVINKKKLPVIVGGSPFYVYSIIEGWQFSKLEHDDKLRKKLNKMTLAELQSALQKIDPIAFKKIDQNNPRRLIRAIEICTTSGQNFEKAKPVAKPRYNFLFFGIKFSNEKLKKRIQKRLKERLKEGMIEEVKSVLAKKLASYKDLERMGLEPRFISYYLQNKINREELEELLLKNIYHFAKRQMTWFRKDKRIKWVENTKEANVLVKKFL